MAGFKSFSLIVKWVFSLYYIFLFSDPFIWYFLYLQIAYRHLRVRNHNLKRDDIIAPLAEIVKKQYPEIKVDLDNPETSIVVEVLRGTCCLGIVTNYSGRSKYNLVEIAQKANK